MGALEEGRYIEEMTNSGYIDMGSDDEGDEEVTAIQEAVRVLLKGLGEDVNREGLRKTPLRVAKAFREGTRGYRQKVRDIIQGAIFPKAGLAKGIGHAGGAGGLVVVRDLDIFSYCESCLLPFQVKCHVGYIPSGQRVVGLSKLSRVAEVFAKRLQDPQRLADEVCSALQNGITPAGVAVVLQCSHLHLPNVENASLDVNHQGWVKVEVSSGSGVFENENSVAWIDFLSLLKFRFEKVEKNCRRDGITRSWCPSRFVSYLKSSLAALADSDMVSAVNLILSSTGEDLSRKELVGTSICFLKWLMAFQNAKFEMKSNGCSNGRTEFIRPSLEVSCKHNEPIHSELNLLFWSQCEHHLLPFHGVVHIGYLCHEGSKHIVRPHLQSIVSFYGFKLQVQERLTRQITEAVSPILGSDVMVVVEANHVCMISRGIEKFGSNTVTVAVLGHFSSDSVARSRFLSSIPNASVDDDRVFFIIICYWLQEQEAGSHENI